MNSKLHTFDYVSRYGFFFLFIFYYSFPTIHLFIEADEHHHDLISCASISEELDEHEYFLNSKHQSECSHENHVHKSNVECELCALVYSLKISLPSLSGEDYVLNFVEQRSQVLSDEKVYVLFQSTQDSRGPPLFF
jgi:hypothetical protein